MATFDQSQPSLADEKTNLTEIVVSRWPSEFPLFVVTAIVATLVWVVLIVSVLGIIYAISLALFFGIIKLVLVGHLRGSSVKLGPTQLPDLHASIDTLARRMRMKTPEAYLMQSGGALNAFAMRFIGSNIIVLYSDLVEACGDNSAARDMIIAHELGHLKCGHVRWQWFILPAAFIPFLASALSRAREYTCDRYGLAGAGDRAGAALGLTILASGGAHARKVNQTELVKQRQTMSRSGLMTLSEWFGSHPPLSRRIAEMDPSLAGGARVPGSGGPIIALALVIMIPVAIGFAGWRIAGSSFMESLRTAAGPAGLVGESSPNEPLHVIPPDADARARADLARIGEFLEQERKRGPLPWNIAEVRQRATALGFSEFPVDPYDGTNYGYDMRGGDYVLWSIGPDLESWTGDDIRYDSRIGRIVAGNDTTRR